MRQIETGREKESERRRGSVREGRERLDGIINRVIVVRLIKC